MPQYSFQDWFGWLFPCYESHFYRAINILGGCLFYDVLVQLVTFFRSIPKKERLWYVFGVRSQTDGTVSWANRINSLILKKESFLMRFFLCEAEGDVCRCNGGRERTHMRVPSSHCWIFNLYVKKQTLYLGNKLAILLKMHL